MYSRGKNELDTASSAKLATTCNRPRSMPTTPYTYLCRTPGLRVVHCGAGEVLNPFVTERKPEVGQAKTQKLII